MTPRVTLRLGCVHVTQLMTRRLFKHYHLSCFVLEAVGIPQRVSNSQKVQLSSYDGFQIFIIRIFLNIIGPMVSQSEDRVARISSFPY